MFDTLIKLVDVQSLMTRIVAFLPNLFSAFVLLFIFWIANKSIQKALSATLTRMTVSRQSQGLILRAARVIVFIFALLTVAGQLKLNVTSLLAGVGVMGLALSFAAQDTIGNIISGIVIIIDGLFKEGDWISAGEMHATVTEIRLRTTVLTTFDNETVVVPNKQLAQERVVPPCLVISAVPDTQELFVALRDLRNLDVRHLVPLRRGSAHSLTRLRHF